MKWLHRLFGCFWQRKGSRRVCSHCHRTEYLRYDYSTGETYWQ